MSEHETEDHLDALVGAWLNLPDAAERLGTDVGRVRRMLQEGKIVAVRRGDPRVWSVPEAFLVPGHLANPAQPSHEPDAAPWAVLQALQGTLSVLRDVGFSDAEAIGWLFTPDEYWPGTPMDALRSGRKTEVRRQAQALL